MNKNDQLLAQLIDSYTQVPYVSNVFNWSAPGYIRAGAYLYGIDTPPVAGARILEIGCAAGGNSLPTAFMYPQAEIIGVDIAENQIKQGQQLIEQAELKNIRLYNMDIAQLPASWGQFDYIIAHGFLSWVPTSSQRQLFALCQRHLQPKGVAYISFNTYPGWKVQQSIRELMLLHTADSTHLLEKVAQAKELLAFLRTGLLTHTPFNAAVTTAAQEIPDGAAHDYYLAHEYLERVNSPMYLHEVAELAAQYSLTHIGDVEARADYPARYGAETAQKLVDLVGPTQRLQLQQYLDFAVGRQFRKSLFSHQAQEPRLFTMPRLARLADLVFAGYFAPLSTSTTSQQWHYQSLHHGEVSTDQAEVAQMLEQLHRCWPRPVSGQNLIDAVMSPRVSQTQAAHALEQLYLHFPLELSRSYEDLPACLQDTYTGLIPGIAQVMEARQLRGLAMNEFNAWYQSSTGQLTATELFIARGLAQQQSAWVVSSALAGAWSQRHLGLPPGLGLETAELEREALEQVDAFIAKYHKYAMYI